MYAGSYLDDHLGGEAINLLHDDHNNNYIFVGKLGIIEPKYNDTVEGVILTRLVKAGVFEVLGIALTNKDSQLTYKVGPNKYIKKQDELDISYNGVPYKKIFTDEFVGAGLSFKSTKLLLPKRELYISDSHHQEYKNSDVYSLTDKRFPTTSLHSYITDIDNKDSFNVITKMINDDSLWEKDRINKVDEGKIIDKHFSLLDIIHKEYDELSYSNFFSYIFKKYPDIFIGFSKDVLNIDIDTDYKISREYHNIDIYVEDKNNILVIENKIKSGINGISPRHDFSENGLIQSQLEKYYEYVEEYKGNKKAYYFLFVPNYNHIDLSIYQGSKHYKVIRYSEIYNYFSKQDINDIYYKEFVNSLYKHTKDREIDYAEDMAYRFLKIINKYK